VENRWIGKRISERTQTSRRSRDRRVRRVSAGHQDERQWDLREGDRPVEVGEVAVVDVRVELGDAAVTTAAMLRGEGEEVDCC